MHWVRHGGRRRRAEALGRQITPDQGAGADTLRCGWRLGGWQAMSFLATSFAFELVALGFASEQSQLGTTYSTPGPNDQACALRGACGDLSVCLPAC